MARHRTALIDWGDAGTGDSLWDLAVLLLDHPDRRAAFLHDYQPDPVLSDHIHRHLDVYRLVRYLGEIAWRLTHGFDATPSIAGARSILRVLR